VFVYNYIISYTVYCEGLDELPSVMTFNNLHLTDTIKEVKTTLKDIIGIYCFKNTITGAMYIGSSVKLGSRFMAHILDNSSNIHLQRAITLYGLPAFIFIVIEFSHPSILVSREQFWINWLFTLPKHLRYNFSPTAGSCLGAIVPITEERRLNILNGSRPRIKPVYFYDESQNLITCYESVIATCRGERANKNHLLNCINNGLPFRGWLITFTQLR